MTERVPRRVYKSRSRSPHEALELLQGVFVAELIHPSRELWIVSPWISNIRIIDNRSGEFDGLDPAWGRRSITLSEVLCRLSQMGSEICVVTRPDPLNRDFIDSVQSCDGSSRVQVMRRNNLHEKGILGGSFHLAGSMNITFYGISINEEALTYITDPHLVSEAHLEYSERYRREGSDQ